MDHNGEIAAAAKSVLAPLGCIRKGRSRTWLDDNGWWVGVIEFQPSSWSKGSYLNVGASYMWKPAFAQSYWSFDAGLGPRPWHDAAEGESFSGKATELAHIARETLVALRKNHRTIASAAYWLESEGFEGTLWREYHLGMAFGLSGRVDAARHYFRLVIDASTEAEWVEALGRESAAFSALLEDRDAFKSAVLRRIQETRSAKKLQPVDIEVLAAAAASEGP
jgi:hypothetical protein